MRVVVVSNFDSMSDEVAKTVIAQVRNKPASVLGLATGSSPLGVYRLLAEYYKNGVDFSRIITFNLDEYVGLAENHPQSYRYYMQENLFSRVHIDAANTHVPNGVATDLQAECGRYDELIRHTGGIDLQILGIGSNAHIGFNEPGTPFGSQTQVVDLTANTIRDNARFFASPGEVPTQAISMGIKSIMSARNIVLMANGGSKADAIHAALTGPVTEEVPASVLQLHPSVTIVVDQAAGSRL